MIKLIRYNVNLLTRRNYVSSIFIRNSSVAQTDQRDTNKTIEVKSYSDIPKVKKHPMLTLFNFVRDKNSLSKMHKFYEQRVSEYGNIYREKIGFDEEKIFTANPDDFKTVFGGETKGEPPVRDIIAWSIERYHKQHGLPLSIINLEGEDWIPMRESLRPITAIKNAKRIIPAYSAITDDFIKFLDKTIARNNTNVVDDFVSYLNKWTFECAGMTMYKERFGMFGDYNQIDPAIKTLYECITGFFKKWSILETSLPHHRKLNTDLWKAFETLMSNSLKSGKILFDRYEQYVVDKTGLSEEECFMLVTETLKAAVETVSETTLWTIIQLSNYPKVQEKMYQEITNLIGDEELNASHLQNIPYVRGALKEVYRTKPLFPIHSRQLRSDAVLSGYHVPAGRTVLLLIDCCDKNKYFVDADDFKPERWMRSVQKECPNETKPHPFTVLPFGHGMRNCPGKRLAENEMLVFLTKFIKNYKIYPVTKDIDSVFQMSLVANKPVSFRLEKRD